MRLARTFVKDGQRVRFPILMCLINDTLLQQYPLSTGMNIIVRKHEQFRQYHRPPK